MTFTSRPGLLLSTLFWLAVTGLGIYMVINIKKFVNFGIDLVGGTYLTLDVKVEQAVKNELLSSIEHLTDELKKKQVAPLATRVDEHVGAATVEFSSPQEASAARDLFTDLNAALGYRADQMISSRVDGKNLVLAVTGARANELKYETVDGNISILRSRLDPFGAGEIPIVAQGDRNIVIELPNVSDPEKAKERIGRAALLEMKPVYDYAPTKEALLEKIGGKEAEGTMIVPGKSGARETGYYLVPSFSKLTGRLLKDVFYDLKQFDYFSKKSPHTVNFQFNAEGAQKFYDLTKNHIGEPIAIIIDGVVVSAPHSEEPISGGQAYISGDFTEENARELVTLLKSGAFTAPVEFIEERHIGPSLGQESISKGLMSCLIGMALLFLFSVLVYKGAGLLAFIVLIYNLIFILFGLAIIPHATLTLPGIAGMVLTVGMAIDSSILIYERIKEELRNGTPLRNAINAGFQGSTAVILDANITTLIVGAVLYYFGSPAIQGFALALIIGIVSTLISGLILLRWFFTFTLDVLGVKKMSF